MDTSKNCILLIVVTIATLLASSNSNSQPNYSTLYDKQCAVCHGANLEGAAQGVSLVGDLQYGDTIDALSRSISNGFPSKGMPNWGEALKPNEIKTLALYIAETRANFDYETFNYDSPLALPKLAIVSEKHTFKIKLIADKLDPLPFSIAPLANGGFLLSEKKRGVSFVDKNGKQSELIEGAPKGYEDTFMIALKQEWGWGWIFDVALHPDYENNGWVYIYYSDRCSNCNEMSRQAKSPASMTKLIRGKINNNRWENEEVIWQARIEDYGNSPDIGAGGRITFDNQGHIFLGVGVKGPDNHHGIQDLNRPWGKIHRINDDGSIPKNNPFIDRDVLYPSIYSYGHRSPQGLEFNDQTDELWSTEMGPRGGDEVNHIKPGKNYGWPLYSLGVNYDGSAVDYGKVLGIEYQLKDIEQPIVDLTPSPAVSSFLIYDGEKFPQWKNQFLVTSLKAQSLYRMEISNGQLMHRETLVKDLARIRDIEQGPKGEIYLLLEHNTGGKIVELKPES